ncbi:PQQ-dependent catabolism-associated beta-propeller protein [Modicisalibacter ilicicola DSM 19980]|uniref:PQQ-dependent catabolism-associated beta-propeller protein n=1 Tax=Modicisalibacter ilicicola DSM 19980 TaxID=1121942 RepID=A0A1M5AYI4_9GAMM|nr:PQQ-dependent catabolism-associated beta-propeller protein [Halomonas ilicicola]SHF35216.1 PQQ-dependent catabolism-associated beta-propeller protein [Halomonas ilicicola DSM 19980]
MWFPTRTIIKQAASSLALSMLMLLPTAAQAERIFVSNEKDNTLSVIDGETLEVIETIPVGRRPRAMAFSNDGSQLFVAVGDDEAIDMIDLDTLKVVRSLAAGEDPEVIRVHPDRPHIYVSNEDDNIVSVLDYQKRTRVTQIPVGVEPEGLGVSPDGKWLIATSETSNMAHIIDLETMEAVYHRLVGARPRHVEFTREGDKAWVSAEIAGTVAIIDMQDTFDVIHTLEFEVPGVPRETVQAVGMELTSDGRFAFVALGPSNRVAVVDQQSYEVLDYLLVGQRVWHLALDADENRLFTTNGVSGDVTVIEIEGDEGDFEAIRSIPVGRFPWGVVVAP